MIKEAIGLVVSGVSLNTAQAEQVMQEIMSGEATPAQLGAFITALKIKGETVDEITGFARTMRDNALHVKADGPVLDIVGTGGDGSGTMNISTCAAFIAAAAGLTVAKHGNRAMSSKCGSADVLECLGVKIDLDAGQVEGCLREVGISFMFAQVFHPAMKYAAAPRREIGIRTVFNILGPLTNPAAAASQVLGVASRPLVETMSQVLRGLGPVPVLRLGLVEDPQAPVRLGVARVRLEGGQVLRELLFRVGGIGQYDAEVVVRPGVVRVALRPS